MSFQNRSARCKPVNAGKLLARFLTSFYDRLKLVIGHSHAKFVKNSLGTASYNVVLFSHGVLITILSCEARCLNDIGWYYQVGLLENFAFIKHVQWTWTKLNKSMECEANWTLPHQASNFAKLYVKLWMYVLITHKTFIANKWLPSVLESGTEAQRVALLWEHSTGLFHYTACLTGRCYMSETWSSGKLETIRNLPIW